MKDRNLQVCNMAWIFAPEPWLTDGSWVSDDILFRNFQKYQFIIGYWWQILKKYKFIAGFAA